MTWRPVRSILQSFLSTRFQRGFAGKVLYEEDFVIAMRSGHPFGRRPTLDRYVEMRHLVVSQTGDPNGFVDLALAAKGRSRRVALTVPNFMMALAIISETDLVTALPRRFAAAHASRFGVVSVEAPLRLPRFQNSRDHAQGCPRGRRASLAFRGDFASCSLQIRQSQETSLRSRAWSALETRGAKGARSKLTARRVQPCRKFVKLLRNTTHLADTAQITRPIGCFEEPTMSKPALKSYVIKGGHKGRERLAAM